MNIDHWADQMYPHVPSTLRSQVHLGPSDLLDPCKRALVISPQHAGAIWARNCWVLQGGISVVNTLILVLSVGGKARWSIQIDAHINSCILFVKKTITCFHTHGPGGCETVSEASGGSTTSMAAFFSDCVFRCVFLKTKKAIFQDTEVSFLASSRIQSAIHALILPVTLARFLRWILLSLVCDVFAWMQRPDGHWNAAKKGTSLLQGYIGRSTFRCNMSQLCF